MFLLPLASALLASAPAMAAPPDVKPQLVEALGSGLDIAEVHQVIVKHQRLRVAEGAARADGQVTRDEIAELRGLRRDFLISTGLPRPERMSKERPQRSVER